MPSWFHRPDAGHNCSECAAGKFKEGIRTGVCVDCGPGKLSETARASSAAVCVSCPEAKFAPAGSDACADCPMYSDSWGYRAMLTDCKCNRGYRGEDGETCTGCERGKYKLRIGNWPCIKCPDGKYSENSTRPGPKSANRFPSTPTAQSQASFECDDNYAASVLNGETRCVPTGNFNIAIAA